MLKRLYRWLRTWLLILLTAATVFSTFYHCILIQTRSDVILSDQVQHVLCNGLRSIDKIYYSSFLH